LNHARQLLDETSHPHNKQLQRTVKTVSPRSNGQRAAAELRR